MKKKLDTLTKAKLIYSGELLVFAIVFVVIATLEFTQVIKISTRHHIIFNWVTLAGGTWILADLIWALCSKKRRKKVALIDKILHAPNGLYLITFDIYALVTNPDDSVFQICIPIALSYFGACYIFEAIYHYFYPVPGLVEIEKEAEKQNENEENLVEQEEPVSNEENVENQENKEEENYEGK